VKIKVVFLSRTALAGAPYEVMRCLNKYTDLEVRWVALKRDYADGRVFPADLLWFRDFKQCLEVIGAAHILHIHNEPFPLPKIYLKKKKIVVQVHSVPRRSSYTDLAALSSCQCTLEQPLQEKEYKGLIPLPNLIDPFTYQPIPKARPDGKPIVVFAPTNRWPNHVAGSKAKDAVIQIMKKLQDRLTLDIFSTLNYEENLARKQRADILIDDVVGETFHRTALEASCFASAVLTSHKNGAWMYTTLDNLESNLIKLSNDMELIAKLQVCSRAWLLKEWHPAAKSQAFVKVYEQVMAGG